MGGGEREIIYYKELAHIIKEAEKSHNLPEIPGEPIAFSSSPSLKAWEPGELMETGEPQALEQKEVWRLSPGKQCWKRQKPELLGLSLVQNVLQERPAHTSANHRRWFPEG